MLGYAHTVTIHGRRGHFIGTGVSVGPQLVLTALHVIDPEPPDELRVGRRRRPVAAAEALPLRLYGADRQLAGRSYRRGRSLTGDDLGTVDLALLVVPTLRGPGVPIRDAPVNPGEHVTVPGYPNGQWNVTAGPVTAADDADFTAHLLLGHGASGAPAIDRTGQLAGLATLDHEDVGTIFVGPRLLTVFVREAARLLTRLRLHAPERV